MKHLLGLLLFIFVAISANAQFFRTGEDPSQIKWRQINTPHFQVIYPEEFDREAQRLTFVLSRAYDYGAQTLNFNPRQIAVVLHTRTINSNGLVAWAPKRMELFTTPHQQIYSQDWLEQLAVHEFRHFVQLDKIQSEMPFILKALLGEQAAAIVTGAYLPMWFLEGDAVVAETALSNSGRGRTGSFSMEYRAQLTQKGKYSFDKAFLGSYKDFVPDHYKLGYWLVGKSREKYGDHLWSDVVDKVASQPLSITPMNSVLKKETKLTTKQLYKSVFEDLTKEWKAEVNFQKNTLPLVSPSHKKYTNYLYPEFYRDSFIVAYKTSIADIGRFVLIGPDQSEKVIYTPGSVLDESVSTRNQYIIWAERRADIRWTHAVRSVILFYNIETKAKNEIHSKNKLFSPAISPDLKSFAAVEIDPENNYYLTLFDLNSGKVKQRFKTDDNQYFFTPCWDEKGEKLFFVSLSSKGKCLSSLGLRSKQINVISPYTFGNLKNPVFTNGQLIFTADFSGVDHLYSLDPEKLQISRIHRATFGAEYPSAANSRNEILFSNYSANGFQLSLLNLNDRTNLENIPDISLQTNQLADRLAAQEKGIPDFASSDSAKYESSKYSKWGHLFHFHSWSPAYIDINNYEIRPGVAIYSQNKLGTAQAQIGYDYDVAEGTGKYKIGFNYFGLFPQFNGTLSYGKRESQYTQVTNTTNQFHQVIKSESTVQKFNWHEWNADFEVRLPLNLSKGKYSTAFFPDVKYSFNQVIANATAPDNFTSGVYHAMTYRFYYYHLLHQSTQNILPRWGQQFDLIYRHTPFVGKSLGTLAGIQSVFYFPGLSVNDGFKIYQGYQEKKYPNLSSFSNFVRFPRGFHVKENNKMYSMAFDYRFPLFYPDFSIGKLAYIKRFKTSLFYDFAWLSLPAKDKNGKIYPNYYESNMKSFGVELTSDLHVLRFFAPIELGVRSIYLPDSKAFRYDLLMSIDFNGF